LIYSQMKPYPKKEAFPKDQNPHYWVRPANSAVSSLQIPH
jgi:hypothetical protein